MIIIWDIHPNITKSTDSGSNLFISNDVFLNAVPIKTIFGPHYGYGIIGAEFTADSKYLITLGNGKIKPLQVI